MGLCKQSACNVAAAVVFPVAGLSDMLRVLSQRASEVIKKDDDEADDDVEMEVEQSDGEEEEDESEDDHQAGDALPAEEEQDDAQGSEEAAHEQQAAPGGKPQRPEAGEAEAEEDDEGIDDNLDDEAMMRLDAELGAAVRSMLSRGGGSAKERAAALLGLQLRVAALLEEWLKKVGGRLAGRYYFFRSIHQSAPCMPVEQRCKHHSMPSICG